MAFKSNQGLGCYSHISHPLHFATGPPLGYAGTPRPRNLIPAALRRASAAIGAFQLPATENWPFGRPRLVRASKAVTRVGSTVGCFSPSTTPGSAEPSPIKATRAVPVSSSRTTVDQSAVAVQNHAGRRLGARRHYGLGSGEEPRQPTYRDRDKPLRTLGSRCFSNCSAGRISVDGVQAQCGESAASANQ